MRESFSSPAIFEWFDISGADDIPPVFGGEVVEKIDLTDVDSKGYCFQIDLTWRTINNGFLVVEVPITFTEREFGQSKMSGSNIREALFKVAEWGIRGRVDRARGVGVTR